MRAIITCLFIMLIFLQYKLWLGNGSVLQWIHLEKKLLAQINENYKIEQKNAVITTEINDLKHDAQTIEELARYELGMVKNNETYYQVFD